MGYLEVDRWQEMLWIHWHGVDDMYAWQEMNGLPRDQVAINSGSITVECVDGEMMLYCEVIPLHEDGKPYYEDGQPIVRAIALPYKEPIPEGIGRLIDWDFTLPAKQKAAVTEEVMVDA